MRLCATFQSEDLAAGLSDVAGLTEVEVSVLFDFDSEVSVEPLLELAALVPSDLADELLPRA
jgi:hypothetical protein